MKRKREGPLLSDECEIETDERKGRSKWVRQAGKEEDLKVLKVVGRYNGMCDNAHTELLERALYQDALNSVFF